MTTGSCPRCVLLIEDDPTLREAIAAFLEARGYATVSAEDGTRAVELLGEAELARPCLVLADLITLRIDWASLIAALEPHDQLATLPMALVSGGVLGRPRERVKKPIHFDLLARIVKDHCCGGERDGGKNVGGGDSIRGDPG
jgi:CheY-like chemotaxis protein